ncbi:MAG: DUF2835 family protein [Opitutae bacterium]|jgi:hypothetical protein
MTQRTSRFSVSLSYDEAKVFYTGSQNRVQVTALDGKPINLPWSALQPLFSSSGLQGHFIIIDDGDGKLVSLARDD